MAQPRSNGFEISFSTRDDGSIEAAYVRIAPGKVASTRELVESVVIADYDAKGTLLGVEIISPVSFSRLKGLVTSDRRASFERAVSPLRPLVRARPRQPAAKRRSQATA